MYCQHFRMCHLIMTNKINLNHFYQWLLGIRTLFLPHFISMSFELMFPICRPLQFFCPFSPKANYSMSYLIPNNFDYFSLISVLIQYALKVCGWSSKIRSYSLDDIFGNNYHKQSLTLFLRFCWGRICNAKESNFLQ